jgi:FMN-dependent NADH-azoreductase
VGIKQRFSQGPADMNLLHIDAGITPQSVTRQLSAAVVAELTAADPTLAVTRRDLNADPIPHLDGQGLAGLFDNAVLNEFLAADVIVIGAPMYNFGVASQLKAWIDHISVAGKTFRYSESGPVGLAGGKTVIVASARGGFYGADTAMAGLDFQETYLRAVFRFLGVDDVAFVRAEGVAISPDHRETAIKAALAATPAAVAGARIPLAA